MKLEWLARLIGAGRKTLVHALESHVQLHQDAIDHLVGSDGWANLIKEGSKVRFDLEGPRKGIILFGQDMTVSTQGSETFAQIPAILLPEHFAMFLQTAEKMTGNVILNEMPGRFVETFNIGSSIRATNTVSPQEQIKGKMPSYSITRSQFDTLKRNAGVFDDVVEFMKACRQVAQQLYDATSRSTHPAAPEIIRLGMAPTVAQYNMLLKDLDVHIPSFQRRAAAFTSFLMETEKVFDTPQRKSSDPRAR